MRKKLAQCTGAGLCMLTGIFLMLYPWISNSWQEEQAGRVVAAYTKEKEQKRADMERMRDYAGQYNTSLLQETAVLVDPFMADGKKDRYAHYEALRKQMKDALLGYVEIPVLALKLPVYMGTTADVLQKGAGHLEGTSVPVGGESTHAVLTGHTGLHTARLFTDLEKMKRGDLFYLDILGQQLTYRVEAVSIVWPEDTGRLTIEKGRDLVTLLTCTPYGVNNQRLLVRGVRTEDIQTADGTRPEKRADSRWMREYLYALGLGGVLTAAAGYLAGHLKRRRSEL